MTYKMTIQGRLPSLNEYIAACRTNPHAGAKMKKDSEEQVMWFLNRLPRFERPIRLHFLWIEPNARRDFDNISSFGRKVILDAMQTAGKLPNDNRKFVKGFSDEFAIDKENPRIEITIEEET